MSGGIGVLRPQALAIKGGAFAAATVLAGAGLLGVGAVGQQIAAAPAAHVHVALTAAPTFADSLQTLLDDMNVGTLNQLLGEFGGLSLSTPLSALLADLNQQGTTMEQIAGMLGISLTERLYSTTGNSLLGAGTPFLVNGVPIGNINLGDLINVLLGPGASTHSLSDLANVLGMGSMLSQYAGAINALGLDNMNVLNCSLECGFASVNTHPGLGVNSSLADWLSGILGVATNDVTQHWYSGIGNAHVVAGSAYTLGEYLHTMPVSEGSSTMMDQATLADLLHLTPSQPWDEYLSGLSLSGSLFGGPSGETLGAMDLGDILSMLTPGTTIDGSMDVTDFLEALGLLNW